MHLSPAVLLLSLSLLVGCEAAFEGSVAPQAASNEYAAATEESVGPFASWTNVKTANGAV